MVLIMVGNQVSGSRFDLLNRHRSVKNRCLLCDNITDNIEKSEGTGLLPTFIYNGIPIGHFTQANHLRTCVILREKSYHLPEDFTTMEFDDKVCCLLQMFDGTIVNEEEVY